MRKLSIILLCLLTTGVIFSVGMTSPIIAANPGLVFVFAGESNSEGLGWNGYLSAQEKQPNSKVQILNNLNLAFENLDLGANNLLDDDYLSGGDGPTDCCKYTAHGLEVQLANSVTGENGLPPAFPNNPEVYVVKTGQGGSKFADWGVGSRYWTKFLTRINSAKALLSSQATQWVVWYSMGINNAIEGTSDSDFRTETVAFINRIKGELPGTKIVMTQFQTQAAYWAAYTSTNPDPAKAAEETAKAHATAQRLVQYDEILVDIAEHEPDVFIVSSIGANDLTSDHWHWEDPSLRILGKRMINITKAALKIDTSITASPNPCILLNGSKTCTSRVSWNFPDISNLKITVRESSGSLFAAQIATGSQDASWISDTGATFDAYSGKNLLGSVFVKGRNPSVIGDFDNDGDVDLFDFNAYIPFFRTKDLKADLSKDGTVDIYDFNSMVEVLRNALH